MKLPLVWIINMVSNRSNIELKLTVLEQFYTLETN